MDWLANVLFCMWIDLSRFGGAVNDIGLSLSFQQHPALESKTGSGKPVARQVLKLTLLILFAGVMFAGSKCCSPAFGLQFNVGGIFDAI
jgi:hypothetical protein